MLALKRFSQIYCYFFSGFWMKRFFYIDGLWKYTEFSEDFIHLFLKSSLWED